MAPPPATVTVDDPEIRQTKNCSSCHSPMGPLCVHQGTNTPGNRGSITQTCKNLQCSHTVIHTPRYVMADADALIYRIHARAGGQLIPPQYNRPLRRAPVIPKPPVVNRRMACNNPECRSPGSQTCIEFLCKKCCIAASSNPTTSIRDPCANHKTPAIIDTPAAVPAQLTVPAKPPVAATTHGKKKKKMGGGATVFEPVNMRDNLAQPIGELWRGPVASQEIATTHNAKALKLQLEEAEKMKVRISIYYKKRTQALAFWLSIPTYPHCTLSQIPGLIDDLGLKDGRRVEIWDYNESAWTSMSVSAGFVVDRSRRTIIRLPETLLDVWSNDDCPAIDENRVPVNPPFKRAAPSPANSPRSKVPRMEAVNTDAASESHAMVLDETTPHLDTPPTANPAPASGPSSAAPIDEESRLYSSYSAWEWNDKWNRVRQLRDSGDPAFKYINQAFQHVFGRKHRRQTLRPYEKGWDSAPDQLRRQYISLGDVPEASLGRLLKGITVPSSILAPTVHTPTPIVPNPTPPHQPPVSRAQSLDSEQLDLAFDSAGSLDLEQQQQTNGGLLVELFGSSDIAEDPFGSEFYDQAIERRRPGHQSPFEALYGYFGPLGYSVIRDAVRAAANRFRLAQSSLKQHELIDEALVPEAQMLLIQQDLGEQVDTLDILKRSGPFGDLFHSDHWDRTRAIDSVEAQAASPTPQLIEPLFEPLQRLPDPVSASIPPLPSPLLHATPFPTLQLLDGLGALLDRAEAMIKEEPHDESEPLSGEPLCMFCDEPFPTSPSHVLLQRAQELTIISTPDPYPSNPGHRQLANIAVSADFCQRHQFELLDLPLARSKGWPEAPDFGGLQERLLALQSTLQEIVDCPDFSYFYKLAKERLGQWNGTSNQLASTHAQMRHPNRAKTSTGYYGEIGATIFVPIITLLFPNQPHLPHCKLGISYDIVIHEILIPEAVSRIIQHDLHISDIQAKATMEASYNFGRILHPDSENKAADAVMRYVTEQRQSTIYRLWLASGSTLYLPEWAARAATLRAPTVIKSESVEMTAIPRESSDGNEIIDLTLDSDDEE
ncbi:hypothetical protein MIND_00583100 [Mycena indigotica]|uniref:Restriction of telomere capping protein 4 n=1 Tax=Mycena indigotica TaxID=2126181 RepID=A0A8H6W2U1_9AGAR|nr:uncharacterized protein MIND_00583100 [Mycena indigotica]KAF7303539.1 hypothetical protein MIND_00583100 [Mycena indigotica]